MGATHKDYEGSKKMRERNQKKLTQGRRRSGAATVRTAHRNKERGAVLAYTVISALFLFFAVGLGVDLGHLYLVKTESQNAADAAALAGASALTLPDDQKIPTAMNRALTVLNQNKYNFNNRNFEDVMSLDEQRALIEFSINLDGDYVDEATAHANPQDIRFIRVTTPEAPVTVFFAGPLLGSTQDISAKATAGMSVPGNLDFCILPVSAIQCDPNQDFETCSLECRKGIDPGCNCDPTKSGYPQPDCKKFWGKCPNATTANPYPMQTVEEGGYDPNEDGLCDPKKEFCKGCQYTVRSEPSNGPAPGAYNLLACAGTGKCDVRMALAAYGDCPCQASPGDVLTTLSEPGQAAGPVRQGLNVRFDKYNGNSSCDPITDPDCTTCQPNPDDHPPDANIADPLNWTQYQAGNPFDAPDHDGIPSRRVMIVPIVPITEYTDGNGRQFVRAGTFGGFFMQEAVPNGSGDIKFEYIGDDISGVIGFDPNDENITNVVTPVLYR